MTRFYFDVVDQGEVSEDADGCDFADLAEAVGYCEQSAREILAERALFGDVLGDMKIRIRDAEHDALREIDLISVLKPR